MGDANGKDAGVCLVNFCKLCILIFKFVIKKFPNSVSIRLCIVLTGLRMSS